MLLVDALIANSAAGEFAKPNIYILLTGSAVYWPAITPKVEFWA
jgi:hypothetical protein